MNPFEFDVSVLFDLQKLVQDSEIAWVNKDLYRNKEGFVCVWKLGVHLHLGFLGHPL